MNPKYPVYIVSKGRWESRLTSKSLESMRVPYKIVVEPQDYDNYARVIDERKILVLPFNDMGFGSTPARNWIWTHSIEQGYLRHWILDDNIRGFERLNRNQRYPVTSGTIFKVAEDFVDRYENIALAGFEYRQFAGGARRKKPPFRLNTRIYSCILVNNMMEYDWRTKYNEDTDLSLRVLKDGWCTILFQCFLQNKVKTMTMSGGNTDTIYNTGDNRLEFVRTLQAYHPEVKLVWRYGRWHHDVDYTPYLQNKLVLKDDVIVEDKVNNYGMKLVSV